jgi:hypothetical protein
MSKSGMLTPILATSDPYGAAAAFVQCGWSQVFATPPDSGEPAGLRRAGGAQVMLGTSAPQFLAPASQPHKGAGVEFHVTVPGSQIAAIYATHGAHADSVTELKPQPWGELAFHAVIQGYRFLLAAEPAGP